MIQQINALLDKCEHIIQELESTVDAAELAIDEVEKTTAVFSIASGLTNATAAEEQQAAILSAIDAILAPLESLMDRAEKTIGVQFATREFTTIDNDVAQAADTALEKLGTTAQSIFDRFSDLQQDFENMLNVFEEHGDSWLGDAAGIKDRVSSESEDALAGLAASIPNSDKLLQELIMGELHKQILTITEGATAFLRKVEAAIEQAGGALFAGVGEITEKADAVQEVLESIKPITEAFEALS